MVNEEGELVPLASDPPNGKCAGCGRLLDSHRYRFNGQWARYGICPQHDERTAGEKRGPEIDLSWLGWLMDGMEKEP